MKRLVVKVGTSTLTHPATGAIDRVFVNALAAQIAAQIAGGREIILVSSGAVGAGAARLGLPERPQSLPQKQAAASVGQGVLMGLYADIFANYGIAVGQVLLTRDDFSVRSRYLNARNTFAALRGYGAIPIVNENDTVATDEIKVGDNDTLAALVASLTDADALVILSDIAGLFDKNPVANPDAKLVETVPKLDAAIWQMAGGAGTPGGTGGMRTKLAAARIATASGIALFIAHGRRPDVLADCVNRVPGAGTYFAPAVKRPAAKKRWLVWSGEPTGTLHVNVCARRVLEDEGRSLLPVGVTGVSGAFAAGEIVRICLHETGEEFGRGVVRFDAATCERFAGTGAGAKDVAAPGELIHRDEMALY
ncbi:MAG: glutamate 5-kinase [Armatimonadetes bacterium]|nr:glutamate 5-kinase [Armatimonadota bacterium]